MDLLLVLLYSFLLLGVVWSVQYRHYRQKMRTAGFLKEMRDFEQEMCERALTAAVRLSEGLMPERGIGYLQGWADKREDSLISALIWWQGQIVWKLGQSGYSLEVRDDLNSLEKSFGKLVSPLRDIDDRRRTAQRQSPDEVERYRSSFVVLKEVASRAVVEFEAWKPEKVDHHGLYASI